jgi:hypothetical protein
MDIIAIATHYHFSHPPRPHLELRVMGQIIRLLVTPAGYPDTSADLDPAESVLLLAIRWWVDAWRRGDDPMPRLHQGLGIAGAHNAAFSIDTLMSIVARTVREPLAIHCPRCPQLSGDEKQFLHAASLAHAGDGHLAEKALRIALLSAQGAEFALGPLEGLAELFAEVRLFFRRRRPPFDDQTPAGAVEPWIPSAPPGTIH